VNDRAGLPVGTYRLHVVGNTYTGSSTTYPWDSTEYTVESAAFEVVPAAITVSASGDTVTASLVGPARGWRYIGHDGAYRGNNPLPTDQGSVRVVYGDGTEATVDLVGSHSDGVTLFAGVSLEGAVRVDVTDVYGNTGGVDL
jgi:hypothetical protein